MLPKNKIATKIEVELISGSPEMKRNIVLNKINVVKTKETKPNSSANLRGASVNGINEISKKLKIIPNPIGCFVLPLFLVPAMGLIVILLFYCNHINNGKVKI